MSKALFSLVLLMLIVGTIYINDVMIDFYENTQNKIQRTINLNPKVVRYNDTKVFSSLGQIYIKYSNEVDRDMRYNEYELILDNSSFQILGQTYKFVIYKTGKIVGMPFRPPLSCIIEEIGIGDAIKVEDVNAVSIKAIRISLTNILIQPPAIRYDIINYTNEFMKTFMIEPPREGIYPKNPIIRWVVENGRLRILLATTIYNLSSQEAYLITDIRYRVYYHDSEFPITRRQVNTSDAILIVSPKNYDAALDFVSRHSSYDISIVSTEWIYENFEEAEPPTIPGAATGGYPLYSTIKNKYNFSLALRIISFLRGLMGTSVKYVILYGDVLSVPPSYYYWDSEFYRESHDAVQSWIPTDFFYASPDYDYFSEFYVGRIPFIDVRDAYLYNEKIERWLYEFSTNKTWIHKISVVGGMPFGTLYYTGEATILDIINSGYLGNLTIEKLFETNSRYTASEVKSLYKGGRIFILQFSHGTETSMVKLSKYNYGWIKLIDNNFLRSLNNASQLPIVVAPACSSGAFDYGMFDNNLKYSLAQSIIFSNAGGIAYVGMSRIAYGALSFYFEDGLLRAPYLLFAQAILKSFYKAYYEGAHTLGEAYGDALDIYAFENDMDYWINIRTLLEVALIGDPLIPLPNISSSGKAPNVKVLEESRKKIEIPLTFGYATKYEENSLLKLNVSDDGYVHYELVSPLITESFDNPFINTSYLEPAIIGVSLPMGGINILKIIDDTGKEQRLYARGKGAEYKGLTLELLDTNNNGKYEFTRLNVTVDFGYYSISSTIWGFRAWIRFSFAKEQKLRINQNFYFKSTNIGEKTITFLFDNSPLVGCDGILAIDFMFFSWWPWLYTWWYSGPAIWTEFALRIIVRIPENSLEAAVNIRLDRIELRSLDSDMGVEAVDLYFRITLNFEIEGYLESMLYLQRKVVGKNGGRIYYLSSIIPYVSHTYKKEIVIKYTWGLRAWYSMGSWGSAPDEEEATITHYYSFMVYLRTSSRKLCILNTGTRRIYELDNLTSDGTESKDIVIECVNATKIYDSNGNLTGVGILMKGYSLYPHFERTEFVLDKKVDGSWETIYNYEITMSIFIFFWPAEPTMFKICYIPAIYLGYGTFRATIRAFKFIGSNKVILAEKSVVFNITENIGDPIENITVSALDNNGDGLYGHINFRILFAKKYDSITVNYKLIYIGEKGEATYASGSINRYLTKDIDETIDIKGGLLEGLENISLKILFEIIAKRADYLNSLSIKREIIFLENISGADLEDAFGDYEKYFSPIIMINNLPYTLNKSNHSMHIIIDSRYSARTNVTILIDAEVNSEFENITEMLQQNITVIDEEEGTHNITLIVSYGEKTLHINHSYVTDLSPPHLNISIRNPCRTLQIEWVLHDLSGVRRIEIHTNDSIVFVSSAESGSINIDISEGTWIVKLVAYDKAGWNVTFQEIVTIDKTPPRIILVEPEATDITRYDSEINISWIVIDNVGIEYTRIIIDFIFSTYIYNNSITLKLGQGKHIITIEIMDKAGNKNQICISIDIKPRDVIINNDTDNATDNTIRGTNNRRDLENTDDARYGSTDSRGSMFILLSAVLTLLLILMPEVKVIKSNSNFHR